MDEYQKHLSDTKQKLNEVSNSFCLAKWKQVTFYLQNGHTHSCHHPTTHHVSVDEIKRNYKALHNSDFKKEQRKLMLNGSRPKECDYCWRVEDSSKDNYSDRVYKSADNVWAMPYFDEVVSKPWDDDVDPSYVEVSFSNVCNFKCSYCNQSASSQWMEEIERYGAYPTSDRYNNMEYLKRTNKMPISNNQENVYVDAFWEWFPEMYTNLKYFRITGGEPLLNKNTFKVLDYIIENPNPNLEVSINTNMNPTPELYEKFIEKVKIIVTENKLKRFKLFTSAEAHGKQSEYIRYGMNYNEWLSNIHKMYEAIPDIQFTVMSTYNILSLTTYNKFLDDVLAIKKKYGKLHHNPMLLDIPYLRYPEHQSVLIMEPEMLKMVDSHVEHMYSNISNDGTGFYEHEADKLKRIRDLVEHNLYKDLGIYEKRENFVIFVDEHDKRRGTNFLETFPELKDYYLEWKEL